MHSLRVHIASQVHILSSEEEDAFGILTLILDFYGVSLSSQTPLGKVIADLISQPNSIGSLETSLLDDLIVKHPIFSVDVLTAQRLRKNIENQLNEHSNRIRCSGYGDAPKYRQFSVDFTHKNCGTRIEGVKLDGFVKEVKGSLAREVAPHGNWYGTPFSSPGSSRPVSIKTRDSLGSIPPSREDSPEPSI